LPLRAAAARQGAGRPRRPRADLAVDGARLHVARLDVRQRWAHTAAVSGSHNDRTRLQLAAATTRFGAGRPRRPRADLAVHRTRLGVARLGFRQGRARRTTIGVASNHRARLDLGAAIAFRRARRPRRPTTDNATDGAGLGVARLRLGQGRARVAAKGNVHRDGAGLRLGATIARLGARGPG